MQAVQPFIDTAISKTVNVPADYPYADFKDLYRDAWHAGLPQQRPVRAKMQHRAVLDPRAAAPFRGHPGIIVPFDFHTPTVESSQDAAMISGVPSKSRSAAVGEDGM